MPHPPTPPADAVQTGIFAFPKRPEDRLRLALRRLEEALGEQSQAAIGLRQAIGDLSGTMSRLGEGVAGYRAALDVTATEIERALATARTLDATAERMVV